VLTVIGIARVAMLELYQSTDPTRHETMLDQHCSACGKSVSFESVDQVKPSVGPAVETLSVVVVTTPVVGN